MKKKIPNKIIRENFIPSYSAIRNSFYSDQPTKFILFQDSPWGINFGIEMITTKGLGYEPINKKIKTIEKELIPHLGEREIRVLENGKELFSSGLFPNIDHIHSLEVKNRLYKKKS